MLFTDTHCHLYSDDFNEDREAIAASAFVKGVERIFLPNVDERTIDGMHELVQLYPGKCFAMMGLHPCSVGPGYEEVLDRMHRRFETHPYVAVGEIGIDLYWETKYKAEQIRAFETQIEWAKNLGLPIVIHTRNSFDEVFEVLDRLNDERLRGIFHCFSGDTFQAKRALAYGGFKLGIGGVLTFKKSGLDVVVNDLDLNDLVLETDAPYLAPTPFRGKRNEPSYLLHVAQKLAEIHGTTVERVAQITTINSKEIFGV
ncbi:MAG: TatD family hydrolase [Bacteroidota bacterium]